MDPGELVKGGSEGLQKVTEFVKKKGIHVEGAYLIKTTTDEGSVFWRLNLITPARPLDVIYAVVDLRREETEFPHIDPRVRINGISPDHIEAQRIISYAQNVVESPFEIIDTPIDGLFVEYALVDYPHRPVAAAA